MDMIQKVHIRKILPLVSQKRIKKVKILTPIHTRVQHQVQMTSDGTHNLPQRLLTMIKYTIGLHTQIHIG